MAINFGAEYRRFNKEMEKKHRLYAQLEMTQEQIDALDAFDKEEFLSNNNYKRHVLSLDIDENTDAPRSFPMWKISRSGYAAKGITSRNTSHSSSSLRVRSPVGAYIRSSVTPMTMGGSVRMRSARCSSAFLSETFVFMTQSPA